MAMYISALKVDRHAQQKLKIKDDYSWHRVVYSLFEDIRDESAKAKSQSSGILWVNKHDGIENYRPYKQVLILSNRPPKQHADLELNIETKTLNENFLDYDHYRFEIVINPVKRDSKSGKIIPIKGREAIAAWFEQRAVSHWGFGIEHEKLQVEEIEVKQFSAKNTHQVTLQKVRIIGGFKVKDKEMFKKSFCQGIGRGKTFGCGLLQIVPIADSTFI